MVICPVTISPHGERPGFSHVCRRQTGLKGSLMTQSSPFPSRAAAATSALEDAGCRPLLSVNHPTSGWVRRSLLGHSSLGALDLLGPPGRPVLATSAAAASQPGSWSSAVLKDFPQPRGYLCHPGLCLAAPAWDEAAGDHSSQPRAHGPAPGVPGAGWEAAG